MGHGGDVVDELVTDHREVEEFFRRIEALPPGDKQRKTHADEAVIELVRHSVAEEAHLYPAVREFLPDGDEIADRELADHERAERLMKQLERTEAGDPAFDGLIGSLMAEIRSHIQDEEHTLFPRLREAASAEALHELGEKVRKAKQTAPTRPHPSTPDTPPANKLLAPGVGLVDRVRDTLSGRGKRS